MGMIAVSTEAESIQLSKKDMLILEETGKMTVVKRPEYYRDRWKQLEAGSLLRPGTIEVSGDDVYITHKCHALVFDSNKTFSQREGSIQRDHVFVVGNEVVVIFDPSNEVKQIVVRGEKNINAFRWLERFLQNNGLRSQPSGALEHAHNEKNARLQARDSEAKVKSLRTTEKFTLLEKLNTANPVAVEIDGKQMTVRAKAIYPGLKIGGKKLDIDTLYESGKLARIVSAVNQSISSDNFPM